MSDIANQGIDLLSEESLRVTFRGNVYTAPRYGMDPVPFTATVTVPLPRMPYPATRLPWLCRWRTPRERL